MEELTPYDKLWNYNDPASTETKFREVLASMGTDAPVSEYLQLKTQLARTQSLQRKFDAAHAILDEVAPALSAHDVGIEHVRYELERGRTFNSAGNKYEAHKHFTQALEYAKQIGADFYTVDALHMLAIVAPPDKSIELNTTAMSVAEASTDERARGWLGALYNNTGWAVFETGDYERALSIFERSLAWRIEKQQEREIQIAKWCVARAMRALQRIDDALAIQLTLLDEGNAADRKDGYVYEELAELYAVRGDARSAEFARTAFELLSNDPQLQAQEAARLERLRKMGM